MKRRLYLIILLAAVTLSSMAQTVGEAFYIYRNDGQFNAFFRDEVDSIAYSHYDADSVYYDENVTQLVYTADSLYRIPLAAIDSVGFVQPEKEFQPDVMRMDETWLPYVIRISENSIAFSPFTPAAFLPQQGQVVVAETFESPFETGFSGRVARIDTYPDSIVCAVEEVLLSDIYQRLVTVGLSYSEGAEESATRAQKRIWGMNTNPGVKFSIVPITDLTVGPVTISCTPTIILKYIVCLWENNLKNYVDIRCYQTYDGSVSFNAKLEKSYTPEPKWWGPSLTVPTGVPGLYGRVQVGGFFRANGSVQLSATRKFYREGVSGFVYSEDSGFRGINEWINPPKEDWEASVSIDGSLSAGVAGRLQFGIMHEKLASADITLYVGLELSGHAELNATDVVVDKNLYSSIKNSEITLSVIADVVPGYQLTGFKSSNVMPEPPTHEDTPVSLKFTWPLNHWYLVPEFDNLKWQADADGGNLSGDISRNLLPKVSLGWGLYDDEDNLYKSEYFSQTYRKLEDWPQDGMSYHLDNLKKNTIFKAYPLVKLLGVEMRADKSVDVCVMECPVTLREFEVTKSQYKQNGFTHEGVAYDYRFDVSVTATLDDNAEGIADWGYVYLDPNGREAFISLKQFGSSYTDTRWAYFRNQPSSTCTLYGYVKYVGSDEPVYGEPHDYPLEYIEEEFTSCPDGNHPHVIDLGLPSGTKWACCNIGANFPEDNGNYYAWGEVNTKNIYDLSTYEYYKNGEYVDIGINIAGTMYDAATVNWGNSWQMPSKEQGDELINNCYSVWTIQNGINGYLFTGTNGNSIFLPAVGWYTLYIENEPSGIGYYGDYLLSTLQGPPYADVLWFEDKTIRTACYLGSRINGHPIRPVHYSEPYYYNDKGIIYKCDTEGKTAHVISASGVTGKIFIPSQIEVDGTKYAVIAIGENENADGVIVFNNSGVTGITISEGIQVIYKNALTCATLEEVSLPHSLTTICDYAFNGCTSLKSISIPDGVKTIGCNAFLGCSNLESAYISKSVVDIGEGIFAYCTKLNRITVENGNTVYDSRNDCNAIILSATNELLQGCQNTAIPSTVTRIGDSAFAGFSFTQLYIPDNITSLGAYVFEGCSNLSNVNLPEGITEIGEGLFSLCTSLKNIIIPKSVTTIGSYAFQKTALTSINIPSGVTTFGECIVALCDGLESVHVNYLTPNEIGEKVFMTYDMKTWDFSQINSTLYVPDGTKEKYETTNGWKNFVNIVETKNNETCPDENHPHMIDLGLPSGTKWACCNVGASTPEQYGNYYAWGETQPKSVYNDVTYSYYTGQDTDGDGWIDINFSVVNIGSDIAGTSYDAATANWGAPWRMPSLTQIKELRDNATFTWTTQNGVLGRKFTGPNGGTIFLPAAGYRWHGELNDAGLYGCYCSSTLYENPVNPYELDFAYGFSFGSGSVHTGDGSRINGLSVRPVR